MRRHQWAGAMALAIVLVAALAADCQQDPVKGTELPLYQRDLCTGARGANDPQVGCATIGATACGALSVDVRVDRADPCTVLNAYVLVNGQWSAQDAAQMMSNQDGKGQVHVELKQTAFPANATTANIQVIVKPDKSPFPGGAASDVTAVPLTRACTGQAAAQPAAAATRPAATTAPTTPAAATTTVQPSATTTAAAATPGKVILAEEFRLVDATGAPRATLHMSAAGQPEVVMWGKDGTARMVFGLSAQGASQVDLVGEGSKARIVLSAPSSGAISVSLFGTAGEPRAVLGLPPQQGPALSLLDAAGKIRAALAVAAAGTPGLTLFDQAGAPRATVMVPDQGEPQFVSIDEKGKPRKP